MQATSKLDTITAKVVAAFERSLERGVISEEEARAMNYLLAVVENQKTRPGNYRQDVDAPPMGDPVAFLESPRIQVDVPASMEVTAITSPQLHTLRLSFGWVNLHQVALIDEKTKTLIVAGVMRQLDDSDIKRLNYFLSLCAFK